MRARLAGRGIVVANLPADPFFQALPDAIFIVYGAAPPKNSALASAGAITGMRADVCEFTCFARPKAARLGLLCLMR
jgi:hypothetical protein